MRGQAGLSQPTIGRSLNPESLRLKAGIKAGGENCGALAYGKSLLSCFSGKYYYVDLVSKGRNP